MGYSDEDISAVVSSQPVTAPAELLNLLEQNEPPLRLHGALGGLYLPGLLTVRSAAEQLLERFAQPLEWLEERFVVATWEDWHQVSHCWSEEECWIAAFDRDGKFCVLNLNNPSGFPLPTGLQDLVARAKVCDRGRG